jgi:hypothetical protein
VIGWEQTVAEEGRVKRRREEGRGERKMRRRKE